MPARNVLHLLGTARSEGASIAAIPRLLACSLDPERYRIHVCFLGDDGPLIDELRSAGAVVQRTSWTPPYDVGGAARFWNALRQQSFDLVHQHFGGRSVRWMARRTTGAPLIMHLHGRVMENEPGTLVQMDLGDTAAVLVNSLATAAVVRGITPEVIYPGVPLPDAAADVDSRAALVVGSAGRLVPLKGFATLLEAFAALSRDRPGISLEIAGSGPEEQALRQQAATLGIAGAVRFLGWCDDLGGAMQRWHLYCHPAAEEALGITVLQAMAAGLPVIASDVGGLPEVVTDGVTGYLVAPGSPAALAERMRPLLESSDLRCRIGAAARQSIRDRFSEAQMAGKIVAVYDRVLSAQPAPARV